MLVIQLLEATRDRLVTINAEAQVIDAARLLRSQTMSLLVVCSPNGVMAGVITKTDIVRQISHCDGKGCTQPVSIVMTREVTFCHPESQLKDAWSTMKRSGLKHIPVVEHDMRPVGVLNARQAVQALLHEVENEEELLRDYIEGIGYR